MQVKCEGNNSSYQSVVVLPTPFSLSVRLVVFFFLYLWRLCFFKLQ